MNYRIITMDMDEYPNHLKNINDAPKKLYCIGNLDLIKKPVIGIVGTRRTTPYGRWVAYEIAKKIAYCGIPIVSGMAFGVDSCAHKACLDAAAGTIAVLGTGIDVPFPKSNEDLYCEICRKGLVISEYEPGTPGTKYNFPRRNRIISGLSSKLIVAEGMEKSGSMITARLALEQGREVFAVPGNINQPASRGVNKLIFDGATPIVDLDSLLEVLGISGNQLKMNIINASSDELKLIGIIQKNPGISIDELGLITGLTAAYIMTKISGLELKGIIKCEGKRLYFAC